MFVKVLNEIDESTEELSEFQQEWIVDKFENYNIPLVDNKLRRVLGLVELGEAFSK